MKNLACSLFLVLAAVAQAQPIPGPPKPTNTTNFTIANSATNGAYLELGTGSAAAVAPSNRGRIIFDQTTNKLRLSLNTGAYADILTGGALFYQTVLNSSNVGQTQRSYLGFTSGLTAADSGSAFPGTQAYLDTTYSPTWTGLHTFLKSGIGTSVGSGTEEVIIKNPTFVGLSPAGAQHSPSLRFTGSGPGAAESVGTVYDMYFQLITSGATPYLSLTSAANGVPTTDILKLDVNGLLTVASGYSSSVVDSSSAVAFDFNTVNSFATSGDELLRIRNAGTEVFSVKPKAFNHGSIIAGDSPGYALVDLSTYSGFRACYLTDCFASHLTVVAPEIVVLGTSVWNWQGGNYLPATDNTETIGDASHRPSVVHAVNVAFDAGTAFSSLGTPATGNGTLTFCTDCTKTTPCASGGTGAIAVRLNGAWDCNP